MNFPFENSPRWIYPAMLVCLLIVMLALPLGVIVSVVQDNSEWYTSLDYGYIWGWRTALAGGVLFICVFSWAIIAEIWQLIFGGSE